MYPVIIKIYKKKSDVKKKLAIIVLLLILLRAVAFLSIANAPKRTDRRPVTSPPEVGFKLQFS